MNGNQWLGCIFLFYWQNKSYWGDCDFEGEIGKTESQLIIHLNGKILIKIFEFVDVSDFVRRPNFCDNGIAKAAKPFLDSVVIKCNKAVVIQHIISTKILLWKVNSLWTFKFRQHSNNFSKICIFDTDFKTFS